MPPPTATATATFDQRGRRVYDEVLSTTTHRRQNDIIGERYGDASTTDPTAAPPVECYRRVLAAAAGRDITIFAAGPLFNLPALLQSAPDDSSPLTGEELVARSVTAVQVMGGAFPNSVDIIRNPLTGGAEWNFWALDTPGVTAATVDRLTALGVPMTFVGYEVGRPIKVGRELIRRLGRDHPTSESFYQYVFTSKEGTELTAENAAFDEVALFHLVEGKTGDWFGEVGGRPVIDAVGVDTWDGDGPHRYLTLRPGAETELVELITDRLTGHFSD